MEVIFLHIYSYISPDQQDLKVCFTTSQNRMATAMKEYIPKNQYRVKNPFAERQSNRYSRKVFGPAQFECDECESKFQIENLLVIHKSARHGNRPASPPKKPRKRRSDARY